MLHLTTDDWDLLDRIGHGDAALDAGTVARLRSACGSVVLVEEVRPGAGRYALTAAGWQVLRKHRRLDPD